MSNDSLPKNCFWYSDSLSQKSLVILTILSELNNICVLSEEVCELLLQSPHADVYSWLGLSPPWESTKGWQCAESGQVLINKSVLYLSIHPRP